MKNFKIILLTLTLLFSFGFAALAQESSSEVTEAVNLDTIVQAEDLEIPEPSLLPDSPFYFLKNWARNVQSFFTFNPIAKAKLRLRFSSERLMEAKKLAEQTKDPEKIKKAIEGYQKEMVKNEREAVRIRERVEKKTELKEEAGKFLDKFTQQQILHQKILEKLEDQVPPEALEKITKARERHLEMFGEVMSKLEEKDKIPEMLEKNIQAIKGSNFKDFKNLEILKNLEEKVPEPAKEAIQKAQENTLKRLKGDLEKMSPEEQGKFKDYTERISGEKEKQLEILENLRSEIQKVLKTPQQIQLKETLRESREKIIENVKARRKGINCPEIEKPAPGFCQEGRIIVKRDERGCVISFECITPGEINIIKPQSVPSSVEKPKEVCITLWDPVCGKDGKTYSNKCWARVAGVEIDYPGVCKEEGTISKPLTPSSGNKKMQGK